MAINTLEIIGTETVPADAEIAVTGAADAAPLTAPDSPDTAMSVTDPATDADGRVVAVWAALNANPGGSATAIGAASGLSRMVAGKILNDFEADGRARREPGVSDGTKGRVADRWYPITPAAPADTVTVADVDAPAPAPEAPDAAPDATPAPDTDTTPAPDADTPDADEATAPEEETVPSGIGSADPAPADEPTDDEVDLTEETAGQGSVGMDGGLNADADADADADTDGDEDEDEDEAESEPVADDPAWERARADLTELADLFSGVISAKAEGNEVMALGCLEMAMTKVAAAHRTVRAALIGTATPARPASVSHPGAGGGAGTGGSTRPGALREEIHAHLIEFPGKEFSSHDMAKALGGRSSGAVANALDRLVQLGEAVLTTERPRRFSLAPAANPAPAIAPTGLRVVPAGDGTAADGYGG